MKKQVQETVSKEYKPMIFNHSQLTYSSQREGKHSNRYDSKNISNDEGAISQQSGEERISLVSSNIGRESSTEVKIKDTVMLRYHSNKVSDNASDQAISRSARGLRALMSSRKLAVLPRDEIVEEEMDEINNELSINFIN